MPWNACMVIGPSGTGLCEKPVDAGSAATVQAASARRLGDRAWWPSSASTPVHQAGRWRPDSGPHVLETSPPVGAPSGSGSCPRSRRQGREASGQELKLSCHETDTDPRRPSSRSQSTFEAGFINPSSRRLSRVFQSRCRLGTAGLPFLRPATPTPRSVMPRQLCRYFDRSADYVAAPKF